MQVDQSLSDTFVARDITLQAIQGSLSIKYQKDTELRLLQEILCRRKRNKALIVGWPGVGKRVIVESLAHSMVMGTVSTFSSFRILELDSNSLRDQEEGSLRLLFEDFLDSVVDAENIILLIEDIDLFYVSGNICPGIREILQKRLGDKRLRLIATTTPDREELLLVEHAFNQHFTPLHISEPTDSESEAILASMKEKLEKFYGVSIDKSIIAHAVQLSNHYIHDKFQPDKSIDLLDAACSRAYCEHRNQERHSRKIDAKKGAAAGKSSEEIGLPVPLTMHHLESYIEDTLKIPLADRKETQKEVLGRLEALISGEIIGQQEAMSALCDMLRVNLNFPVIRGSRPKAVFLLLGPTGVGKTATARIVAKLLFNDEKAFIRLNMSEYSESHSVSRLIGAPPGYIGYNEGVVLSELIKGSPNCLLLLDEVEKAHPNVLNLFLQVFDDGTIRDSKGELVSFRDTVIIMTGNIGAELLDRTDNVGFLQRTSEEIEVSDNVLDREIRKYFSKEFINRIDRIILFKPIHRNMVKEIIERKYMQQISQLLQGKGIELSVDDSACELLVERGYNPRYGVRFLERKFNDAVAVPVGRKLCQDINVIKKLHIRAEEKNIIFDWK